MGDKHVDTPSDERSLATRIWGLLGSIKFAVGALLLIAAASVYGAMTPPAQATEKVWHSLWYRSLLGIILLSAVVCTVDRFDGVLKRIRSPRVGVATKVVQALRGYKRVRFKGTTEGAAAALTSHFSRARYSVLVEDSEDGGVSLLARKGMSKLLGAPIVHVSLVVIIAATIWGVSPSLGSYRQVIQIREGEFTHERHSGIWVGCDDFEIVYSEETLSEPAHADIKTYYKVSEYISKVTFYEEVALAEAERIVETIPQTEPREGSDWPFTLAVEAKRDKGGVAPHIGGSLVGLRATDRAAIRVNQPAHVQGHDFYQQSCDIRALRVTVTTAKGARESHDISLRLDRERGVSYQPTLVPLLIEERETSDGNDETPAMAQMPGRMVGVTAFAQRFEKGMPLTAGQHMAPSPAVRLEEISIDEAGQVLGQQLGWVQEGQAMSVGAGRFAFDETIYDTVLEVRRQPGVWLLIVGFAISGVGLILAFWVPMREIRAKIISQAGEVEVLFGIPRSYRGDDVSEIVAGAVKALRGVEPLGGSRRRAT